MGKIHGWPSDQKEGEKSDHMDKSTGSQGVRYCTICNYEAEDMYDLDAHTWSEHDDGDESDHHKFCKFCDDGYDNLRDLMIHNKKEHSDKVNTCWHFSVGNCPFGDENCWFIHSSDKEYKCNLCGETYSNQTDYLNHKKRNHENSVKKCKNMNNGSCKYGDERCWFKHTDQTKMKENEETETIFNEKNEVVQKLFMMMEKMTEQIFQMEMINQK